MARKGQAALEFLMTYGWAILVVLAAIAALAYFGVLSPDKFIQERCIIGTGLSCEEPLVQGNTITLQIYNGLEDDLGNVTVSLTDGCTGSDSTATLVNGEAHNFEINCSESLVSGTKIKAKVKVEYNNLQSGLGPYVKTGEMVTQIP